MKTSRKAPSSWRRVRHASLCGAALAFIVSACTDDAIVYPNRGLKAQSGEAGALATAGEGGNKDGNEGGNQSGNQSGGAPSMGGGAGSDGTIVGVGADDGGGETGMSGGAGTAGASSGVCGNGIVEPPEECDDGNTVSGDGCSKECKSHCETCESKVCPLGDYDYHSEIGPTYDDCYKVKGNIVAGPAAGAPRADICRDLVDCIRAQKCAQTVGSSIADFKRCWCDVDFTDPHPTTTPIALCISPATFVPGKCADEFQAASEADTPNDVFHNLSKTSTALGAALRLLQGCDASVCVEECLPGFFGDPVVANITQDLTVATNPSGESQIGDLTADAQRMAAGADVAVVNPLLALCPNGAPSTTLAFSATPDVAADADGRVLWSEALATQFCYSGVSASTTEFTNAGMGSLVKGNFTGQQLYDALTSGLGPAATGGATYAVSGLTYTWQNAATPAVPKVIEIRKDGVPINRAANFTVALTTTLASALSGLTPPINGTAVAAVPNASVPTLFGVYLSQLPQPVSPPVLNRITIMGN